MKTFIASNGVEITDEKIKELTDAYDKGELPKGYRFGEIHYVSNNDVSTEDELISCELPKNIIQRLKLEAKELGTTSSNLLRNIVFNHYSL